MNHVALREMCKTSRVAGKKLIGIKYWGLGEIQARSWEWAHAVWLGAEDCEIG